MHNEYADILYGRNNTDEVQDEPDIEPYDMWKEQQLTNEK